jgi:CRP/FNR family transcriptional regulator
MEIAMTTYDTVSTMPGCSRAPADTGALPAWSAVAHCKTVCATCELRELCAPCCGLARAETEGADRLVFNRLRVRRGDRLYRTGNRFTSLYAVRNGFFKSVAALDNGRDQVTGFSMPGDVLGLDGIGPGQHACDTVALEDSEVCAIPFGGLQQVAHDIPVLQHHFRKMMSREIVREHGMILQLGSMTAEERVAMFLLDLSRRYAARGYPASEFKLPMKREEIASFLGLKLETVSRNFSRFQDEGLIAVQQKFIRIRSSDGLLRLMGRETD